MRVAGGSGGFRRPSGRRGLRWTVDPGCYPALSYVIPPGWGRGVACVPEGRPMLDVGGRVRDRSFILPIGGCPGGGRMLSRCDRLQGTGHSSVPAGVERGGGLRP